MEYKECDFTEKKQVARLYGLTVKTLVNWEKRVTVEPIPWDEPFRMLEWYRVYFGREPKSALIGRAAELQSQLDQMADVVADADGVPEQVELSASVDSSAKVERAGGDIMAMLQEVCGNMGLAVTVARVVEEESRAHKAYLSAMDEGRDPVMARKAWTDATKLKRELSKAPDAVEAALQLLKHWVRSEWETKWRALRDELGGRKFGAQAREVLAEVVDDPVAWRRVWDTELEIVLMGVSSAGE